MEKSKVYFTTLKTKSNLNLLDKLEKLVLTAGLDNIDFKNKFTAIKYHFGEPGNIAYIRHNYLKRMVEILNKRGAITFATDSNTLYKGRRKNAVDHLTAASENGFNQLTIGCPVIIADGLVGTSQSEVPINLTHVKNAKIGSAIADSEIIISLNHFKGHEYAGFGGCLKNLGMGSASIPGKLEMHSSSKPFFNEKNCTGCAICYKNCAYNAITLDTATKTVKINPTKCVGCGQCVALCQFNAMCPNWNEFSHVLGEKIAEYAYAAVQNKSAFHVNFIINVSPNCDCFAVNDIPIVPDIGIAASFDPVALDRACIDLVNNAPINSGSLLDQKPDPSSSNNGQETNKFKCLHGSADWEATLKHGEKIGLGKNEYSLIKIDE